MMKLKNTTEWPDYFLRRLVSWCCKELGLSPRKLRECAFRNSRSVWGGMAYWRSRIGVRVGKQEGLQNHWKFNLKWLCDCESEKKIAKAPIELLRGLVEWARENGLTVD